MKFGIKHNKKEKFGRKEPQKKYLEERPPLLKESPTIMHYFLHDNGLRTFDSFLHHPNHQSVYGTDNSTVCSILSLSTTVH